LTALRAVATFGHALTTSSDSKRPKFPGSGLHPLAQRLNTSVQYDQRLWREDIRGSRAHAAELLRQGLLTDEDHAAISTGLDDIHAALEAGSFPFDPTLEDVHMNIEARLSEAVGEAGRRLHTGRSRNDQVATDLRLHVMTGIDGWLAALHLLRTSLVKRASETVDVLLPGYTHLQRAQPVRLALHLLAYYEMFSRDSERLRQCAERTAVSPLGSAAMSGTGFPYDRDRVAMELGFARASNNALDAVSDRDFAVELNSAGALVMVHLSRLGEELVLWSTAEFGFAELDPAWCTGSSIMPQKRNPDLPELLRAKSGRVTGNLMGLLMVLKGLPLAYNKDMQEDKEPVFDTLDTVLDCLHAAEGLVATTRFVPERMRRALDDGFPGATELADFLVEAGVPFREAYAAVRSAVDRCRDSGRRLEELTEQELSEIHPRLLPEVLVRLKPEVAVERRSARGGTARTSVVNAIRDAEAALNEEARAVEDTQ